MGEFTFGTPAEPVNQPAATNKPIRSTPRPSSPVRRRSTSRRRQSRTRRPRSRSRARSRSFPRSRSPSVNSWRRRIPWPSESKLTIAILKMFWWLIHGVIAVMVVKFETPMGHNFVALLLLMPEFSVERLSIASIFKDSKKRSQLDGIIFFFYVMGVVAIAVVICGAVKGLLTLGALYTVQDLSVMAGFSALATTCVVGPVDMLRFVSRTVGWLILLLSTTMYVQMGLIFIPVFYVLILAVSLLDYFVMNATEPERNDSFLWI